ncbi:hypothetical protein [Arthrobacter sp. H41]|uniref:hypothetical protein n=1 Tax=Arthrobacter sp. H41 TaxID=1312978 RepID=UPI00047B4699|nr:hypothetical protein [Arthrobacter sp. H41]
MPEPGEWALTLAGSPWLLLILYALATIDGFFPPVPSEGVVGGLLTGVLVNYAFQRLPRVRRRPA